MSRTTGNKPIAPRKSGSSLLTGILIGMVIGAGMAAGLAWYIMQSPSPFLHKEHAATKPALPVGEITPDVPPAAASGVTDNKQRFEFYKVLTDKEAAPKPDARLQPAKPPVIDSKPLATGTSYFLQAGSFSNPDDAEKLRARLALLGIEASTQTATIPDKGVWHRVRMGPYKNTDEMNRTRSLLKQNGVDTTPIRAQ